MIDFNRFISKIDRYYIEMAIVDSIKILKSELTIIAFRIQTEILIRRRRFDSDSLIALAYKTNKPLIVRFGIIQILVERYVFIFVLDIRYLLLLDQFFSWNFQLIFSTRILLRPDVTIWVLLTPCGSNFACAQLKLSKN